ncbi:His-Xaa-Ser system radical SAM maturase HxsC [Aeromonas hydrophila]|uniref:His-Xaa-Ser system radical SAM maturase HxsC n=1 Tax=Aeromonas hydrophila TaxID=644 RepID=UPI0029D4524C|nr:His-Xaa-Ser system radical SAM maturase HxsC [Aeromonas hydrophila]MDX7780230.1 His-Xaa-Ser system radical SAM maturase HxsC [Aeromonas hydrophila]
MSVVKINFKPISDSDYIQYEEQIALAVNCWSDDYVGKNLFYLYDGGAVDHALASAAKLIICPPNKIIQGVTSVLEIDDFEYLVDGSVMSINTAGKMRVLFNPRSLNNALFVTDACNNFCIMCPQPPKPFLKQTATSQLKEILSLIRSKDAPEVLGITGGEPTMIKEGLLEIIKFINAKFPSTGIQLLSNGRLFAYGDFTHALGNITKNLFVCVPLFGATPDIHDYIVQSEGAFYQTLAGLYECKRNSIDIELRVVLHKQTIEDLDLLVEFIHRNLPFVGHVAFMGMENMGFAKMNYSELWIDPVDYMEVLGSAVKKLSRFGMTVSVFNLPFCIVDKDIWSHCKQSISDFKTVYSEKCNCCSKKIECAGFFSSTNSKFLLTELKNIKPL